MRLGERARVREKARLRAGLCGGALTAMLLLTSPASAASVAATDCLSEVGSVDLAQATIPELQAALQTHQVTSRELVAGYLARIRAWDSAGPRLDSIRELNPAALQTADAMDAARAAGRAHGPLFGVPVLLKDNINTNDMHTTAGAVALRDNRPANDAFITAQLRAAGAIILGKSNLTEFANYVSSTMPAGFSGLGGQVLNPYDLAQTPSGSSAGPGVASATAFAAATVGSETDGSILSPSDADSDVGIKPTLGLLSRTGIIPISHRQDTAGPITRNVTDAAVMLTAMAGADPADPATTGRPAPGTVDYTAGLHPGGLRGVRLGIVRSFFNTAFLSNDQLTLADQAVADMQAAGAVIVDNVELPDAAMLYDPTTVLMYDFKQDLNAYLASLGPGAPYRTLADIIAFNTAHPQAIPYGQDTMTQADTYSGEPGTAEATDADRLRAMTTAQSAIDGGLAAYNADALIFPSSWSADIGANAGYPSVIVPAGYGATSGDRLGITFLGTAFSESKLITFAYGYEQQTHLRVSPTVRNRGAFPCPVQAADSQGPEATAIPPALAAAPSVAAAPETTPAPASMVASPPSTPKPAAVTWRLRLATARAAVPGAARTAAGPVVLVGIGIAVAAAMVRRRRRRGVPR